jgi:hypothetical protein
MAGTRRTDLLGRLADMSEDAIQRLSDAPGADKLLGALNTLKDRTDDLQKRVRGLEDLEKRLTAVEEKVAKLSKAEKNTKASTATKSPAETAAKDETTAKKD